MSTLRIRRADEFADYFRAYSILLDGTKLGNLKHGETLEFSIAPGQHQLRMKIDWCGSNTVQFIASSDGDLLTFRARSNLKGLASLKALYYVIFKPDEWIVLEQEH